MRCSIDVNQPVGNVGMLPPGEVCERAVVLVGGYRMGRLVSCETSPNAFTDLTRQYTISWGPQWICDDQLTVISTFHVPHRHFNISCAANWEDRRSISNQSVRDLRPRCMHSLDLRTHLFQKIGERRRETQSRMCHARRLVSRIHQWVSAKMPL